MKFSNYYSVSEIFSQSRSNLCVGFCLCVKRGKSVSKLVRLMLSSTDILFFKVISASLRISTNSLSVPVKDRSFMPELENSREIIFLLSDPKNRTVANYVKSKPTNSATF